MSLEDRFEIDRPIHAGQVATAYPAIQRGLDRKVLLKVLHHQFAGDRELVERFSREGKAIAKLDHPNVVRVYDCGVEDGVPYLAMEWVEGKTLKDLIAGGPVSSEQAIRIAEGVLSGLAAVHGQGLLHRDIKPDNILIGGDGRARVADFSLAGFGRASSLTAHGALVGSPAYMAPELIDGKPASARSDLYALGIVLLEALTGSNPFAAEDPIASLELIRTRAAPRLSNRPRIDPALGRLVDNLLEKDPSRRPASADEALGLLRGKEGNKQIMWLRQWRYALIIIIVIMSVVLLRLFTSHVKEKSGEVATTASKPAPSPVKQISPPAQREAAVNTMEEATASKSPNVVPTPAKAAPAEGRLALVVKPWADVWMDGRHLGTSPIGVLSLPVGKHEFIFRQESYPEIKKIVHIIPGRTDSLSVDLRAESGELAVSAAPWGYLFVDGDSIGLLPRAAPLYLKPGVHLIEVRHPGLPSFNDKVELMAGKRLQLSIDLTSGTKIASYTGGK